LEFDNLNKFFMLLAIVSLFSGSIIPAMAITYEPPVIAIPPILVPTAFGASVSIGVNRVLVGAPLDDLDGENAGAAYMLDFDGKIIITFNHPNPFPILNERFGTPVSLWDNNALIGSLKGDKATSLLNLSPNWEVGLGIVFNNVPALSNR